MNVKSLLSFLLLPLLFVSCKREQSNFSVVAEIAGMPEQTVLLEEMRIDQTRVLDSVKTGKDGRFELRGSGEEPGLYRLHFAQDRYILLSVYKEQVRVSADWNLLEKYTVSGSPASESLRLFFSAIRTHVADIRTMTVIMDSMRLRGNDSMLLTARRQMDDLNLGLTQYIERYADTTVYLPNALFAVQILNPAAEKPFLDGFVSAIPTRFPNTALGRAFVERYKKGVGADEQEATGPAEGSQAPEINLNTPDGKTVSLSSLRGKYVLVDFWASWCNPCRRENPNVVAAYKMFKDKNFTILGVSLDNDKEKWQAAIQQDNLEWTQVSDLKGWESVAARDYGISSIPGNFLIDPSGKIVARDLRGPDLEDMLKKVLQ